MLAALLPLILGIAPQLAEHLFGRKGGDIAAQVAGAVTAVTGTDLAAPGGAEAAILGIQGKSELAAQLQTQLAGIASAAQVERDREADAERQADADLMKATLASQSDARAAEVALSKDGSKLAWGAPVLSAIILLAFGGMLWVVLTRAIPENSAALANVLLGTLAAMATQVANFWLGSSNGSASKNDLLASAQTALANSIPASQISAQQGKAA